MLVMKSRKQRISAVVLSGKEVMSIGKNQEQKPIKAKIATETSALLITLPNNQAEEAKSSTTSKTKPKYKLVKNTICLMYLAMTHISPKT